MTTNADEDAYVIDRLSKLLAEIAVAVNGPEPAGTLWSYHDLPEKVRALVAAPAPGVDHTSIKLLIKAARSVVEADGGIRYEGEEDEIGSRVCCGVVSYENHASDCYVIQCREAITALTPSPVEAAVERDAAAKLAARKIRARASEEGTLLHHGIGYVTGLRTAANMIDAAIHTQNKETTK